MAQIEPVYLDVSHILNRACWVYRYYNRHGEIIYVGVSIDTYLIQRAAQHLTNINPSHRKDWRAEVVKVDVAAFADESSAEAEEQYQIALHQPKYNTTGKKGMQMLGRF